MRAAIYLRTFIVDKTEYYEKYQDTVQMNRCIQLIEKNQFEYIKIYSELDVSGKTEIKKTYRNKTRIRYQQTGSAQIRSRRR